MTGSGRAPVTVAARRGLRARAGEFGLGMRFAVARGSRLRTALTALGLGLAAAMLLLAAAVPGMLDARDDRGAARADLPLAELPVPTERSLLVARADTTFRGDDVRGRILQAEGPRAPLPPGLRRIPGPGEMAVSPALAELLASSRGELLRDRLPYRVTATIGAAGLTGPAELAYYAGSSALTTDNADRIDRFGFPLDGGTLGPLLTLLAVTVFAVLPAPVAVFVAVASRFGADARERRLAAVRLLGADLTGTRCIAAGEALAAALGGLFAGALIFLMGRQIAGEVVLWDVSVFPSDIVPSPALTALVVVAVPATAVAAALFALRGVEAEPLGVVRRATPPRMRWWWRLLPGVLGAALLAPGILGSGDVGRWRLAAGILLLLFGLTALLPWVVEAVAARPGTGPVAWLLAARRMGADTAGTTRLVGGVTVTVAGAVAVQMLLAGVGGDFTSRTGQVPDRADLSVRHSAGTAGLAAGDGLAAVPGVRSALTLARATATAGGAASHVPVVVGSCDALREVVRTDTCAPGDAFVVADPDGVVPVADHAPGGVVDLATRGGDVAWTVPARARPAGARPDPMGAVTYGVFLTPEAPGAGAVLPREVTTYVRLDPGDQDAAERVRNAVARIDATAAVTPLTEITQDRRFTDIRRGLYIGSTVTLILVAAGMLVSTLEQLRERRRPLAALAAIGVPRTTLGLSVLAQTAVPMVAGLVVAVGGGLGLGAALLTLAERPPRIDAGYVAAVTGTGAAAVLAVTAMSLPLLWRLMRPDGLRTE